MSRNIGQKKRFEVLQRDWFACKYCWQKAPFVQLEVDHIVPRSNWGTNEVNNLITACFNCNRWKWSTEIIWDSKNLYKTKINDFIYQRKINFYNRWNSHKMGMIDEKTKVLLSMVYKEMFWWNAYTAHIEMLSDKIPPKMTHEDWLIVDSLFKLWSKECDIVLKSMWEEDYVIEYCDTCFDDSHWNSKWTDDYSSKLNYLLTSEMNNRLWSETNVSKWFLVKYTLHPKLITNG